MFLPEKLSPAYLLQPLNMRAGRSGWDAENCIGVEIELEGWGAGAMALYPAKYWSYHNDPSLRGDCGELTLKNPLPYLTFAAKAIPEYENICKNVDFKPALSERCSVHVHFDFSHKTVYNLLKFITVYALLEEMFFEAVGPNRRGNPFCLRLTDAPAFVQEGIRALVRGDTGYFRSENYRYMALNLAALFKFGSVEIRLHQGESDPQKILQWVTALYEMYTFACTTPFSPAEILGNVSKYSVEGFLRKFLPINFSTFAPALGRIPYYSGIDVAQDFAYSCEWPSNEELAAYKSPFSDPVPAPNLGKLKKEKEIMLDEIFAQAVRAQRQEFPRELGRRHRDLDDEHEDNI